jgi:hypothetical protein
MGNAINVTTTLVMLRTHLENVEVQRWPDMCLRTTDGFVATRSSVFRFGKFGDHRGCGRIVVGFTTTYAISQ